MAIVCLGINAWTGVAPAQAQAIDIFGHVSVPAPPNADLRPFSKWNDMLHRMEQDRGWENAGCSTADCPQQALRKLLSEAGRQPRLEQMAAINAFFNRIAYVPDAVNWNGKDYWETPHEFFDKGGECKDYAIAKYFALRSLGWPVEAMWLVVLQDMNLNVTHAILAVKNEGKFFILDNQVAEIVEEGRIHHYRPIFGLDEGGWVLFRTP